MASASAALEDEDTSQPWFPGPSFAMRLAQVRAKRGESVKTIALRCGINHQSWTNWERGKSHPRDYEAVVARIADALGVDPAWLASGEPSKTARRTWLSANPRSGAPHDVQLSLFDTT